MPIHIFREVAAAHIRTATHLPMAPTAFAAYFDQWEGETGRQMWLRKVRGFNEQDTRDFEPLLGDMITPTLLIWGEQDAWLDPSLATEIQHRLPDAERVLIPRAGHFSPEDQPDLVTSALADFLS